ncbi:MAG: glutamate 5-kinase, partial [Rhodoplanes sp.]
MNLVGREGRTLAASRRVVVKIGSALLVEEGKGTIRSSWLEAFAADVAALRARGQEVLIVTSGAVAVGRRSLRFGHRALRLAEKQAAAATGMVQLAQAYQEALDRHGLTVALVLLTLDDSEHRRRYINARNTLTTLLGMGALPLINENDTVATDEIRFGDNDRLSARVAAMVSADMLVLLSDIDGLYTGDPHKDPNATLIPEVRDITPQIEASAGAALPGYGTGGRVTKLAAAKIAIAAGCGMVIADGKPLHALQRVDQGGPCTWFMPSASPQTARKRWIGGSLKPSGALTVDEGAARAL